MNARIHAIVRQRVEHQGLSARRAGTAADLVAWMGAVQAQEYDHARWGLGLRLAGDLFWMQALAAPRVHARMAPYNRRLELDARTLTRATGLIERALAAGAALTRAELGQVLRRARLTVTPMRLAHIAMHAELEGVICSGPRRERQFTYALAGACIPRRRSIGRDESLGELATRYLQSHGPATIRDFVWWSGLTTPDAVRASEIAHASSQTVDGRTYLTLEGMPAPSRSSRRTRVHLLPIYDEYLVAYRDRFVVPHRATTILKNGRVVGFMHALVIDGQVAGTWRTAPSSRPGEIELAPLRRLTAPERRELDGVSRRYARFWGVAGGSG